MRRIFLAVLATIFLSITLFAFPASAAEAPNRLVVGDFETDPWASYSVLDPAHNNWFRYCNGDGHGSSCFVEMNGGTADAVSLQQDVSLPTDSQAGVHASAAVRCPVNQGPCQAVVAVWGDPGSAGQESLSSTCDIPADGQWRGIALYNARFAQPHQTVRWELYNRTPGSNLDVDDAFLAVAGEGDLPLLKTGDLSCPASEPSPTGTVGQGQPGVETQGSWSADKSFEVPVIPGLGDYRIGFFIIQEDYGIGPFSGAGDGRSFDPKMRQDQNRVFVRLSYEEGDLWVVSNPSCTTDRGECTDAEPLDGLVSADIGANGVVELHIDIPNSRVALGGHPRITADLTFLPATSTSACVTGSVDSFPSVEIYHDRQGVTDTVWTHEQSEIIGAAGLVISRVDLPACQLTDLPGSLPPGPVIVA